MAASDTFGPSRFLGVTQEPEDAILGITLAFKKDTHPDKLNLGVGAYRTEEGKPFVLEIVRQAERYLAEQPDIYKEYLPIDGLAEFRSVSAKLVFGKDSSALCEGRIATVQALSGTGSLRIGAAFAKRLMPDASVYLSTPTWGNHPKVFTHAEVPIKKYRYFKPSTRGLDFEGMYEDIENAPDGSIILLHGCAHNPTGVDPTHEQWSKLCTLLRTKRHLPFFDVAYQGFASGDLDRDAWAVRHFVAEGMECFVAQSYAKNFGLYGERVGALHVVSRDPTTVSPILSQLKTIIRPMYSNPPAHGARIVVHVLENEERFADWKKELKGMASRIEEMRTLLYEELNRLGIRGPWDHIKKQIGMFTFTGLRAAQVECLTKEWHIYMTRDGRISMAGLSKRTVPYLARAIGAVGGLSVEE